MQPAALAPRPVTQEIADGIVDGTKAFEWSVQQVSDVLLSRASTRSSGRKDHKSSIAFVFSLLSIATKS